jgi:hypothetical protein
MSVASTQSPLALTAARPLVRVGWRISEAAARDAGLVPGASGQVVIEVELLALHRDPGRATLRARLVGGSVSTPLALEGDPIATLTTGPGDLRHADAPGVLALTWRDADPAAIVYVRTEILNRLGIPGGRYEPATLIP